MKKPGFRASRRLLPSRMGPRLECLESRTLFSGATVPLAPSGAAARIVSSNEIDVSWKDNSSNESGFVVDRAKNSRFTTGLLSINAAANRTSAVITGLIANTTYYFRVRAINSSGSVSSNVAGATTAIGVPRVTIGGLWNMTDLLTASNSAAFRALGTQAGLYLHNNGWDMLASAQKTQVVNVFAGTGPQVWEAGFSTDSKAWSSHYLADYIPHGVNASEVLVNGSDGTNAAGWPAYVDSMRSAGVQTVMPVEVPNLNPTTTLPFADASWNWLRSEIGYGGGLGIDTPPAFWQSFGNTAYGKWVQDATTWCHSNGYKTNWIISPYNSVDLMGDTQSLLASIENRGIVPDEFAVENYEGSQPPPTYTHWIGTEDNPQNLLGVALWLIQHEKATAGLPSGFTRQDIGSPAVGGSSLVNGSTWTVTGGGSDIWNTSDQFHYVSASVPEDATVVAKVMSIQNTNTWAKGGVMFRGSGAADAQFADVVLTPGQGVSFQWRSAIGGACKQVTVAGVKAPAWVKLVRTGNTFSGFYSTDGIIWKQIGTSQSIGMGGSALAGLAVSSHDITRPCTAVFNNFSIVAPRLSDAGFETPAQNGGYAYKPAGSPWTFTNSSGITANHTAFTGSNANAPEGSQVAFLQGANSSISQSIAATGAYSLTFAAAQRANAAHGGQDFEVLLDGKLLGAFRPASTSYADYTLNFTVPGVGVHTLEFLSLDTSGGDNTAFIDNLRLKQIV